MKQPHLKIMDQFVDCPDELFRLITENVKWDERMKSRKTASFGVAYDYSEMSYPQTEMPTFLGSLCEKIKQAIGFYPNNCLMNYYADGHAAMGYHSDQTEQLAKNTGIIIISLGAKRAISFRAKNNKEHKVAYPLSNGSLLFMGVDVQEYWMHAIPRACDVGPRVSLTFRQLIQ